MPSIAPAVLPPGPTDVPADSPALGRGRSLTDYVSAFALDLLLLRGRDVLEVAAGPSSFVAEACARRIDAVAVDPAYDLPPAALAARWGRAGRAMGGTASDAEWRSSVERFLADYEASYCRGRYVWGGLPQLPFFDGTFDLVICGSLPAGTDQGEALLAACHELLRVSAGEVRVRPAASPAGRLPAAWTRVRRELRAAGVESASCGTAGGPLLILRRAGS